ncbi:hypothetical protein BHE74_00024307 [Ensete ventricosum]|nr:hypothetical protein GW17_00045618 [Ensete ventricosum]RWW68178.1 hypothetical protein BHE74_00024307 [Ensete ventricosum]RZS24060.1 hypothetical protein BHM03_00057085 [Ensete ventricosum]
MPSHLKGPKELQDQAKYYRFYRDYGYDTEHYHDLRNQLEELIRHGYLGRYVWRPRDPSYDRRGLLRCRSTSLSGARCPEEITCRDEGLMHGLL